MSDIAKLAGVRRATVYNHFPTDVELIDACSSHWFSQNPPPDPTPWTAITDPARRTEVALEAMYGYYDRSRRMLENVLRDAPLVAALDEILGQKWWPMMDGIVEILAVRGSSTQESRQPQQPGTGPELRASLKVALDFFTWETLAESGLSNASAARLATAWVEAGSALAPLLPRLPGDR